MKQLAMLCDHRGCNISTGAMQYDHMGCVMRNKCNIIWAQGLQYDHRCHLIWPHGLCNMQHGVYIIAKRNHRSGRSRPNCATQLVDTINKARAKTQSTVHNTTLTKPCSVRWLVQAGPRFVMRLLLWVWGLRFKVWGLGIKLWGLSS